MTQVAICGAAPVGTSIGPYVLGRAIAQGADFIEYEAISASTGTFLVREFWPKTMVSRSSGSRAQEQPRWQDAYRSGVEAFVDFGEALMNLTGGAALSCVARVRAIVAENNTAYLVMDRPDGPTLAEALGEGTLGSDAALATFAQTLGRALAELHAHNLLHLNISPDTILLQSGNPEQPVLIRFGVTHAIVQSALRSPEGLLAPGYTPSEQYEWNVPEGVGTWSDVYAASAVLFRCLNGQPPSDLWQLRPHLRPLLADQLDGRFPVHMLRAIDDGLAVDVQARPTTAQWAAALAKPDDPSGDAPPSDDPSPSEPRPVETLVPDDHPAEPVAPPQEPEPEPAEVRSLSVPDGQQAHRAVAHTGFAVKAQPAQEEESPSEPSTPPDDPLPWWTRWNRWQLASAVVGAMALLSFVAVAVAFTAHELPDYTSLKSSQNGQMIVVRARDGSELVSLGPSYGRWLPYSQIPAIMRDAMVTVEDKRFRDHYGVDPIGIARSVKVRLETGQFKQGGSTITQQLARNVFLQKSGGYSRKLREIILALALETKFSKDQILELYLNKVYFGGGAYGIDAASRKFFGHPATELSTAEAAIIAGLVKAPSNYSPTADIKAAIGRGKVVLGVMAENGVITRAEADAIDFESVTIAHEKGQNSVRYFTDWALPQLDLLLPDTDEPLEVWTTLDPAIQKAATASIQNNVPKGSQGALVSMDLDGAVLAMVGGTDYVNSNYNRATTALRQPGSAWKLFVYLAALEAGYRPEDEVIDQPVTIDGWSPQNSGQTFAGTIDVRTAFAYSKNTVAAQLGNEVGFGTVASMARRFGITSPITTVPSMVLGTSEVRVIDMTRAFAAVSAGGTSVEPFGIRKVTTMDGEVLYEHKSLRGQVLVPQYVAAGITDLLQTAVATGTGRAAQIGRPVAGKTGTTTSNKDGWFLGFSSGVTTGVWMGRDDAKAVTGLQGGHAPARAFADFMKVAVAGRPIVAFDTKLQLPEWQLEPDDELLQGDPNDYYYVDENGNLVEPGSAPGSRAGPDAGPPRYEDGTVGPGAPPDYGPPPATNDDFLDRATDREALSK